ncbi:MAG: stage V sporulation protein SpoVM [Oscillospiraceae bacterium]|nr:stage V sporulation protein SpoVM [Oscillospiraceae bacterium]
MGVVHMKIVVVKSPRFLAGLLRMFFKIEKDT